MYNSKEELLRKIEAEYPLKTDSGKLTFCGILRMYFDDVSKRWHSTTPERYLKDYYKYILPNIPKKLAIDDFDMSTKNKCTDNTKLMYMPKHRIRHIEWLIEVVYLTAYNNALIKEDKLGLTNNPLRFKDEDGNLENAEKIAVIKRSLGPSEAAKTLDWYIELKNKDHGKINGQDVGICIMVFVGTRNQEACGLDYNSIMAFKYRGEMFHCLVIRQVMKANGDSPSNIMKTPNAFRYVPISNDFFEFLIARKNYTILQLMSEKQISKSEATELAGSMPIANYRNEYERWCTSDDLSKRAKEVFKNIGIGKFADEAFKELELIREEDGKYYEEKEPTAYLLRRNFATYIYLLGFSDTDSQYIMGHKIEDGKNTKAMLASDEKMLYNLWKRIEYGPYSVYCSDKLPEAQSITPTDTNFEYRSITDAILHLPANNSRKTNLQIFFSEPANDIKISFPKSVSGIYAIGPKENHDKETTVIKPHIQALLSASDKCNSDKNSD